jgi:septal ring factor EnvC (AmiA/AmiB activator)
MKKNITIKFEPSELERIKASAAEKQTSVSAYIRDCYYRDQDSLHTIRSLNTRIDQLEKKLDSFIEYHRKADRALAQLLKEIIALQTKEDAL